jgi:hypothetical protein
VTYFNGAPAAGRTITATYRTPASGISGALAGDNQPWAEITVDGVAQVPRQKILTVPFAVVASSALSVAPRIISATLPVNHFTSTYTSAGAGGAAYSTSYIIPLDVASISKLVFSYSLSATSHHGSDGGVAFFFEVVSVTPATGASTVVYSHRDSIMNPVISTFNKTITTGPIDLPKTSNFYRIDVGIVNTGSSRIWPATSANTGTFSGVTANYIKE